MLLYEIEKKDLSRRGGNIAAVIASGEYCERGPEFVESAFNYGRGTARDMNRYMRDNSIYCVWINAETMERVTRYE